MTKHQPPQRRQLPLTVAVDPDLDALYAEMPTIDCQGRCQDSCGSVALYEVERNRIAERHDLVVPDGAFALVDERRRCPALNPFGRCSVHVDRPFICRLWGLTEAMRCPYRCVPVGGWVPERQARQWLERLRWIQARADGG